MVVVQIPTKLVYQQIIANSFSSEQRQFIQDRIPAYIQIIRGENPDAIFFFIHGLFLQWFEAFPEKMLPEMDEHDLNSAVRYRKMVCYDFSWLRVNVLIVC